MKTIKLELSVKLLLGAIALGLFLNAFNEFPPKANANNQVQKVAICQLSGNICADMLSQEGIVSLFVHDHYTYKYK